MGSMDGAQARSTSPSATRSQTLGAKIFHSVATFNPGANLEVLSAHDDNKERVQTHHEADGVGDGPVYPQHWL